MVSLPKSPLMVSLSKSPLMVSLPKSPLMVSLSNHQIVILPMSGLFDRLRATVNTIHQFK